MVQTYFVYVFEVTQDESHYSKGVSLGRKSRYSPRGTELQIYQKTHTES